MYEKTISRIPYPSKILKGNWDGIVYAIYTMSDSLDIHEAEVEATINNIKIDYDNNNHYSVSLREVKRENVVADDSVGCYMTLVQFRVRDSY